MSTPVVQQGVEKPQLASTVDAKEDVEYVDTTVDPIAQEQQKMTTYDGPKVRIKILLMSSQNHVFTFEPETSVGRVKETVWSLWPADWNTDPVRPPSPAYFRFLYMGKMLSDEQTLAGLDLKMAPATTIIHLSVRTIPPEEETTKKSLLGFSLRPSMRGRASSNNVPTTTHGVSGNPPSHSTPTATSTSAPQPQLAAAAPATSTSRSARRRSIPQNVPAEPSTRTRSRATVAEDGTHGTGASGGCKCAIM